MNLQDYPLPITGEREEIMNRYEFTITLSGEGNTPEEGWRDAVEAFELDPGNLDADRYTEEEIE